MTAAATPAYDAQALRVLAPLIPGDAARLTVIAGASDMLGTRRWAASDIEPARGFRVSTPAPISGAEAGAAPRPTGRQPRCVIILPEALEEVGRTRIFREIEGYWGEFASGDTLIVRSRNHLPGLAGLFSQPRNLARAFLSLRLYRRFRSFDRGCRGYIFFGRNPNESVRFISTKYSLQRRFVKSFAARLSLRRRGLYECLSLSGIYPWLEREHVFVVTKC